jgi:alpha-ketoglutarate-dependent taurine dioxygenase
MIDVHLASAPITVRPRYARANPFDLSHGDTYRRWLASKLEHYPQNAQQLIVEIRDPSTLSRAERGAIIERCRKTNMAIYACAAKHAHDKKLVQALGEQLGLCHMDSNLCADADSISSVRVMPVGRHHEYIPYSNQALKWHTDGYYNPPAQRVRAFILHCASAAAQGGDNALLDPEIVYLLLRNANTSHVRALMQPDAMHIPANVQAGVEIRGACTGPVFALDDATASLHMRYSARRRYIRWKTDVGTQAAVRLLEGLLAGNSDYIFRHRLQAGQGIICNNVLHSRAAFMDDPASRRERLLYRARYYERIAGTFCKPEWA